LNNQLKTVMHSNWLELAARWILGLTFIYASYHKILAPADFAKIVYGYDLFPDASVNLIAIILPFMELVLGFALVIGFYPQSAALLVNALILAFIIILSVNLIRGHEFDCGCFSSNPIGGSSFSGSMLIRNFILLALGLWVLLYNQPRKLCVRSSSQLPSRALHGRP